MEISSTRLLVRLREQANIVVHVLRSGRHMSTAKQPNYGNVQLSAGPVISSQALPVAPAESFEDPVARKLAALCSKWFVPEATVARAVGLESATALRAWKRQQTLGIYMFGADARMDNLCRSLH